MFVILFCTVAPVIFQLNFRDKLFLKSGYQLRLLSNADSTRSTIPLIHDLTAHTIFRSPTPHITLTKSLGNGGSLPPPKTTQRTQFWHRAETTEQLGTLLCLQRVNCFQFVQKKKLALDFTLSKWEEVRFPSLKKKCF